MKTGSFRVLLVSAVLLLPGAASAQDWTLHLTPKIGYYTSDKPLGVATTEGIPVRLAPSTMFGLVMDVSTGSWWNLRFSGETSFGGQIEHAIEAREEQCGPNCTDIQPVYSRTGEFGNLLILGMQGVVDPAPKSWRVAPYLVLGAGVVRYELPDRPAPGNYDYGGREASFTAQGGLGLRIDAGPGSIRLEAVNNMSGFTGDNVTTQTVTSQIFGPTRHDLTFSLGYRLRLF